jgi:hypothetical protein
VLLHIALHDGFFNDHVLIEVNGREVYRKTGVSTRQQIGYADSVETDVQGPQVKIVVALPEKNLSQTIHRTVTRPTYLGLSVTSDRRIDNKISADPFGYL